MLGSAFMFGSIAPSVKAVFMLPGAPTASALSFARGAIISLPLLPVLLTPDASGQPKLTRARVLAAAELACYTFALNALLNEGLAEGGSATKAAFLLQGAVVFTPALCAAAGQAVAPRTWAASALALAGVALLAFEVGGAGAGASVSAAALPAALDALGAAPGGLPALERADVLFLGSALAWALTIVRLGAFAASAELSEGAVLIQGAKNLLLAGLYGAWLAHDVLAGAAAGGPGGLQGALLAQWPGGVGEGAWQAWGLLALSAAGGGLLGDLLQAIGQRAVPPAEANVLLTTEPLWAAGITALTLGERMSVTDWVGGAVLIAAALLATAAPPAERSSGG